jgi:hypothetical protein
MRSLAWILGTFALASFGASACSSSSSSPGATGGSSDASAESGDDGGDAGDAGPSCGAPAMTTFACEVMPANEGACEDGPAAGGDAGAGSSYPLGCVATIPKCDALYGTMPVTCTCKPLGMTAMWVCGS